MKHLTRTVSLLLTAAALVLIAPGASAQNTWGPRAGLSANPDQLVVGAHLQFPVATNLYFLPNADVAFGDDVFTFSLNGDLAYRFASDASIKPYVGGGLSYFNYDVDGGGTFDEIGVGVLVGFWFNSNAATPFFVQGKLFLDDSLPDFKVMAGVNL
jgi:hypothetical protein